MEEKIVSEVIDLGKTVGRFAHSEFKTFDQSRVEYKGVNDLVSYVDKQSEKKLVEGLRGILPGSGFIAEEGTERQQEKPYMWIIDPLDGTTNFVHGIPMFSVSIALLKKGGDGSADETILGVIYDPSRDECFSATGSGPALCNNAPIDVSTNQTLSQSLVATGFPFTNFDYLAQYMPLLQDFIAQTHGVRRMGSAAIDLAYVACGRFEGFFEYNLNAWDVAAGALIVRQAGGNVTDFSGGDNYLFGRQIVAAGPVLEEMLTVIRKYFPG